jgi:CheY-like chemotaxis protein
MNHILVVDDDVVSQRVLRHMLNRAGYLVHIASDALEALRVTTDTAFDLAILDISMPDVDGIELLTQLRGHPDYKSAPIIMLTASSQDEDRVRAQDAGASAFMTKPVSSAELVATVQSLL